MNTYLPILEGLDEDTAACAHIRAQGRLISIV
jgi:hypothetical protein